MVLIRILVFIVVSNSFFFAQSHNNKSRSFHHSVTRKFHRAYPRIPGALPYRSYRRSSENEISITTSPATSEENDKTKKLQVPQINFYNSVPNAIGVIGQGYLMIREVANAVGTPIPLWVGAVTLLIAGVMLMFVPDLTQLNLPLFYPSGALGDPLAAFPPLPEIDLKDVELPSFVSKATKFISPRLIDMEKL